MARMQSVKLQRAVPVLQSMQQAPGLIAAARNTATEVVEGHRVALLDDPLLGGRADRLGRQPESLMRVVPPVLGVTLHRHAEHRQGAGRARRQVGEGRHAAAAPWCLQKPRVLGFTRPR